MSIDVLVVDDDPDIRGTLTELLRDEGYEAENVSSTSEFCLFLEREHPKVVLLDLTLPGQDLSVVLTDARERNLLANTVLLALSGLDEAPEIAARLGLDGSVKKPFDIAALLERLERLLAEAAGEPGRRREAESGGVHPH